MSHIDPFIYLCIYLVFISYYLCIHLYVVIVSKLYLTIRSHLSLSSHTSPRPPTLHLSLNPSTRASPSILSTTSPQSACVLLYIELSGYHIRVAVRVAVTER